MLNKLAVVSLAALATTVAVASPADVSARTDGGDCNTGPVQCCNSTQSPTSSTVTTIFGLLGLSVSGLTGLVGFNCSPITGVGIGGSSCSSAPVCCSNNEYNGLINIGCTPITINL